MKLEKILDNLNSVEKNSFLKIIDGIISDNLKKAKKIDNILSGKSKELKKQANKNIAVVFILIEDEFADHVRKELIDLASQLDILIDIVVEDGNRIMKQDRYDRLYENQLKDISEKKAAFKKAVYGNHSGINEQRKTAYKTYLDFFKTVYYNDWDANHDAEIVTSKLSILLTLSQNLGLSQEDVELINHIIIPVKKLDINTAIMRLENIGVIFYSRKTSTIYAADEIVRVLRKVRGKETGDKLFSGGAELSQESHENLVCEKQIKEIKIPINDIHKGGTIVTAQKKFNTYSCDN